MCSKQQKFSTILILIFAEALGLYGLIVGLVVASTVEAKGKGRCTPYNQ